MHEQFGNRGFGKDEPLPYVSGWRKLLSFIFCLSCVSVMTGCALYRNVSSDLVSISNPKVYTDDEVLRMLSERRKALGQIAQTVQGKDLQEVFGVREASSNTLTIKGEVTSEIKIATPTPPTAATVQLPTAPTAPSTLGLAFPALLQKTVERDQLLTGLQKWPHSFEQPAEFCKWRLC